jgi:hypothetical protein
MTRLQNLTLAEIWRENLHVAEIWREYLTRGTELAAYNWHRFGGSSLVHVAQIWREKLTPLIEQHHHLIISSSISHKQITSVINASDYLLIFVR